jgi:hypothetical protein
VSARIACFILHAVTVPDFIIIETKAIFNQNLPTVPTQHSLEQDSSEEEMEQCQSAVMEPIPS